MNLDQSGKEANRNFEFIVNKVEMKEKWLNFVTYD
jgi:hypothetical protein